MGIEFVNRVMIYTIILGIIAMAAAGAQYGLPAGLGVLAGAAWGTINLYLIKRLIESLMLPTAKNYFNIAVLFGIKFPILYLLGFALFKINYLPPASILLGFSLFFLVIILKGCGVWLFGKKETTVVVSEDRK